MALDGASFSAFEDARATAADAVEAEDADLADRLDDAASADVSPVLVVVAGGLAALLAVAGTLDRGRRYR
jgi:hypothetical protein